MILLIDVKKFKVIQSRASEFTEIQIEEEDVITSQEDLEHLLAFIKEVYQREQIITELKNLGIVED